MPTTPTLQDEVAFISGVKSDGTLTQYSYWGWNGNTPPTYNTAYVKAAKFGANTAGTAGGTVTYYFDPTSNWSANEQAQLAGGLALWAAVANINFVKTTDSSQAKITFHRGNDGGAYTYTIYNATSGADRVGGSTLGTIMSSPVSIDTNTSCFSINGGFSNYGGYGIETLIHEEGHALGLGHAGAYNGSVNTWSQQYSAYDNRQYSLMSYIDPGTSGTYTSQDPVSGTNWNGHYPTTWMPLDILAIQRLYGVATSTPLSGGQTFGFNCNVDASIKQYFDFTVNKNPVITLWDKGTGNTLDISGFSQTANINLNPGTYSSTTGMVHNIAIAFDTKIDRLVCGNGATTVIANNDGDTIIGGSGNDTFTAGAGNDTLIGNGGTDTVVYSGNFSAYTLNYNSDGSLTVSGNGTGTDTLSGIETVKFADKTYTVSSTPVTTPPPVTAPPPSTAKIVQRDFNGDGQGDVLLAINGNTSIHVWTMNGTTVAASGDFSAPNSNYTNIRTGDFNGDGKTDLLWQNVVTGAIQVWTMNGTSTVSTATLTNPGVAWQTVATGDVDGDGKTDLILQNGGSVQVWQMNGASVLSQTTVATAAPVGYKAIATGDFNGDGKADILWQNPSTGALEIWQMNGAAVASDTVLSTNPGSSMKAIATGDFNGDGKSDILLQDTSSGQTAIWFMNGSTVLSGSGNVGKNLGTSWNACGSADYNGDGFSDILFRSTANGQYQAFMMNGTSVTSSGALSVNPGTGWHAVTEASAITTPVATASTPPSSGNVSGPGIGGTTTLPVSSAKIVQRDFNGDGKGDILLAISGNTSVHVWTMNGTTLAASADFSAPNSNFTNIRTGDFNGDGKTDLLWQNVVTGAIQVWTMNGTSRTATAAIANPDAKWQVVATGDVGGDGKTDLILQNGSAVQVWQMNGGTVASVGTVTTAAPSGFNVISTGDFNADGKADILWQNSSTGALEIWQMNGATVANDTVLSSNPGSSMRAITTGDFNGDGKSDILMQNTSTGQAAIWFMDGSTVLAGSGNIAKNLGSGWTACGSADYNGDGISDVLFRNGSTGQYQAFMMSGTSVLSNSIVSSNPGTGWHAVAS
jgi:hypothetical protein